MKIIDSHVHFSALGCFKECAARSSKLDFSDYGYMREAAENNIVASVCMGLSETGPFLFPDNAAQTPMTADLADEMPEGMRLCLGVNPHTLNKKSAAKMEEAVNGSQNIAGFKIYAGYYHVDVFDAVYAPVYKLAEKYDLTVAIHSGDTFSDRGLLAYSHPLHIDRVAVEYRDMRIVICHIGSPWILDACELAYKNKNVYFDMSGLLIGDGAYIEHMAGKQLFLDRIRSAFVFLDNYDKALFGTDWPLVPMKAYIKLCKELVPEETYEKVFFENANRVFKLGL